jgi:hypothetical protein
MSAKHADLASRSRSAAWASLVALACAIAGWASIERGSLGETDAAIARFEAAEDAADRAVGGRREAMRRQTLQALAEAVRLDESLGASAVRLALEVEEDPERRSHLERLAEGLDRRGGRAVVDAATAVEASRFLAEVRRGDRREAKRLFERPELRRVIDRAVAIDRRAGDGTLPDFEAWLAAAGIVALDDAQRRATLELELALLEPEAAGLGLGSRLDGGSPLAEVDARGLAEWFEAAGR